jgi:hypothetical protein
MRLVENWSNGMGCIEAKPDVEPSDVCIFVEHMRRINEQMGEWLNAMATSFVVFGFYWDPLRDRAPFDSDSGVEDWS